VIRCESKLSDEEAAVHGQCCKQTNKPDLLLDRETALSSRGQLLHPGKVPGQHDDCSTSDAPRADGLAG